MMDKQDGGQQQRAEILCRVCGDKASGKHYGVASCDGCRGFFKRSIRRNLDYVCKESNSCIVDVTRRNQCQACRFRKCLQVNMKRDAVQHERAPRTTNCTKPKYNMPCYPYYFPFKPFYGSPFLNPHHVISAASRLPFDMSKFDVLSASSASSAAAAAAMMGGSVGGLPPSSSSSSAVAVAASLSASMESSSRRLNHHHQQQHHHHHNSSSSASSLLTTMHNSVSGSGSMLTDDGSTISVIMSASPGSNHNQLGISNNNNNNSIGLSHHHLQQHQQPQLPLGSGSSNNNNNNNSQSKSTMSGAGSNSSPGTSSGQSQDRDEGLKEDEVSSSGVDLQSFKLDWNLLTLNNESIYESAAKLLFLSVKWARSVPSFLHLPLGDQAQLLEEAWPELFILTAAQWSLPIDEGLLLTGSVAPRLRQETLLAELRFLRDALTRIGTIRPDHTELACMKALVLFKPEAQSLREPLQVEILQDQTHLMLQEYCATRQPPNKIRFGKLLLILPSIRRISGKTLEELFFKQTVGDVPIERLLADMLKPI